MTVLVKRTAQCIHRFCALADQTISCTEDDGQGLLRFSLWFNKPHLRPLRSDHNCFGIRCIVLLAFDERTDILRSDELYLIAKLYHLSCPVTGASTSFENDNRLCPFRHEATELFTRKLLTKFYLPRH